MKFKNRPITNHFMYINLFFSPTSINRDNKTFPCFYVSFDLTTEIHCVKGQRTVQKCSNTSIVFSENHDISLKLIFNFTIIVCTFKKHWKLDKVMTDGRHGNTMNILLTAITDMFVYMFIW